MSTSISNALLYKQVISIWKLLAKLLFFSGYRQLFELILAPDTGGDGTGCDNMTCVIVRFSDDLRSLRVTTDTGAVKRSCDEMAAESTSGREAGGDGKEETSKDSGDDVVTESASKKAREGD